MVWDKETIRDLKTLWEQGFSTAEIGRRLGTSKNSIVGKAHRLDLPARPSPILSGPQPPSEKQLERWKQKLEAAAIRAQERAARLAARAERYRLSALEAQAREAQLKLRMKPAAPPPQAAVVIPKVVPQAGRVCLFPDGGWGKKVTFQCREPQKEGSSYCVYHHGLCHEKPARERREQEAA